MGGWQATFALLIQYISDPIKDNTTNIIQTAIMDYKKDKRGSETF